MYLESYGPSESRLGPGMEMEAWSYWPSWSKLSFKVGCCKQFRQIPVNLTTGNWGLERETCAPLPWQLAALRWTTESWERNGEMLGVGQGEGLTGVMSGVRKETSPREPGQTISPSMINNSWGRHQTSYHGVPHEDGSQTLSVLTQPSWKIHLFSTQTLRCCEFGINDASLW